MTHIGQVYLKKPQARIVTGGGSAAFDSDYQAILNYGLSSGFTAPSPENQVTQNAFLVSLKSNGIWGELDVFYNFFTDGDANFAKINWKAPGTFQAIGTGHEPTFIPLTGFQGNGVGQYLDTQWIPSAAVKYTLNNASIFSDIPAAGVPPANYVEFGSANTSAATVIFQMRDTLDRYIGQVNSSPPSSTFMSGSPGLTSGFIMMSILSSTNKLFVNGTLKTSSAVGTVALPATSVYLLAYRLTSPTGFSKATMSMFGAGSSLSGKEAALYNSWNSYKASSVAAIAYKKIIDYAVANAYTVPSDAQQADQKRLISDLVSAGIWDLLDLFYNFLTDGDSNFAKINWKNPGTFQAIGTGHEPVFTVNKGFKANGTTQYLKTGLVLNTAPHHTSTDAGYFISVEDLDAGAFDAGAFSVGFSQISASGITSQINSLSTPLAVAPVPGLSLISVSPTTKAFLNGTLRASGIAASAVPNMDFYIFARNNTNVPDAFSSRRVTMFGLGGSLAGKEAALYNSWSTYKNLYYVEPHPYDKILQYATSIGATPPSATQQILQRQFVDDLVSAGIWAELDIFYNFITDGNAAFASINWKNPGANQLAPSGGVAFVSNFGVNLTAGSFNTGYKPNSQTKFYQNASMGLVCNSWASSNTNYMWGGNESTTRWATIQTSQNRFAFNSTGFTTNPGIVQLRLDGGFIQIVCESSQQRFYVDGALGATVNSTNSVVDYTTSWIIGGTAGLATANVTVSGLQLYFAGGGMIGKQAAFYNAWNKYRAPIISKSAYKAITDYATSQLFVLPSAAQQVIQEALIADLITAGIWDDLDVFYNFFTDGDANFAKINWKNPGTYQAIGTGHDPVFTVNNGFNFDTNAKYLDSQFPPSSGVRFKLSDASVIADLTNPTVTGSYDGGTRLSASASEATLLLLIAGGNNYINGTALSCPQTAPGLHQLSLNAGALKIFRQGVQIISQAAAPVGLSTFSFHLNGYNNSGTHSFGNVGRTASCLGLGASLAGKELSLYNSWAKYKATIQSKIAYKAIIDYATSQSYTLPSAPQQTLQQKLVYDLMFAGVWDNLDVFYNFKTDGGAAFAKINWINPSANYITLVPTNVDFFTNDCFKGNGGAFNTNFIATGASKVKAGDLGYFGECEVTSLTEANSSVWGIQTGVGNVTLLPVRGGNLYSAIGSSANVVLGGEYPTGFFHGQNVSGTLYININGTVRTSASSDASLNITSAFTIFGISLNPQSTAKVRCFGYGSSLKGKELVLYNAWNAYRSAISAMSIDLIMLVGTDGIDKGYLNGVYGGVSPLMMGDERITGFYSQADNTIHLAFEGAAQIEGVDRIMIQIPGEEAELLWTGVDYAGVSVPVATQFSIVDATVNFTLAT